MCLHTQIMLKPRYKQNNKMLLLCALEVFFLQSFVNTMIYEYSNHEAPWYCMWYCCTIVFFTGITWMENQEPLCVGFFCFCFSFVCSHTVTIDEVLGLHFDVNLVLFLADIYIYIYNILNTHYKPDLVI